MKDAPRITYVYTTYSHIKTYSIEESKFVLNSAWSEDLLRKMTFRLKSIEFKMYPLKFDPKQKADITPLTGKWTIRNKANLPLRTTK